MAIETKFNIGDELWLPRVYAEVIVDSIVIDGKTYYASAEEPRIRTYRPEAKKFVINEIELTVTADGIDETYYGKHIPEDGSESAPEYEHVYSSKFNNTFYYFSSKEDALKAAQALADKEEPYYG